MGQHVYIALGIGGLSCLLGLLCLWRARVRDEENWIIQRAPALPVSHVNPGDDVWISGRIECPNPLYTPYTGMPCVYFSYRLEERVRKTRVRNKRRETYWTWVTRQSYSRWVDFMLRDRTGEIWVRSDEARFDAVHLGSHRQGNWRHTESVLTCPSNGTAIGTVEEGRSWLTQEQNIPLIVTHRPRDEYLESAEKAERWIRGIGYVVLAIGAAALAWGVTATTPRDNIATGVCIFLAEAVVALLWGFNAYNQLVSYRNRAKNAWHLVDVELRNRYDTVGNLVEVVKAHMAHEKQVFEAIATARSAAMGAADVQAQSAAEVHLTSCLRSLIGLAEAHPELKANESFLKFHEQLSAIETKIAVARGFYNDSVLEYNTTTEKFPLLLVARLCGFRRHHHFSIEADARSAPSVG